MSASYIFQVVPFTFPFWRSVKFQGYVFRENLLEFRPWSTSSFSALASNMRRYQKKCGAGLPSLLLKSADLSHGVNIFLSPSGHGAYVNRVPMTSPYTVLEGVRELEQTVRGVSSELDRTFGSSLFIGNRFYFLCFMTGESVEEVEEELAGRWRGVKFCQVDRSTWLYSSSPLTAVVLEGIRKKNRHKVRALLLSSVIFSHSLVLHTQKMTLADVEHCNNIDGWYRLVHWFNPFIMAGLRGRYSPFWGLYLRIIKDRVEGTRILDSYRSYLVRLLNFSEHEQWIYEFVRAVYTVPSDNYRRYLPPLISTKYDQGDLPVDNTRNVIEVLESEMKDFLEGRVQTPYLTRSNICVKTGDEKRRNTSQIGSLLELLVRKGIVKRKRYRGSGSRKDSYSYCIAIDGNEKRRILVELVNEMF